MPASILDSAQRQATESPRQQARATEVTKRDDRFIARASHELRNPLTSLRLRLYLAKVQPDKLDEHFKVMEMLTDRMTSLVEDLLDMSRFGLGVLTLNLRPVSLQDLIADVIDLQRPNAEAKSISLRTEMPRERIMAVVDRERIEQVLVNLLVNAVNYSPGSHAVTVQLVCGGNQVLISVCDTGQGIAPELFDKIFEPFFRGNSTDIKGTGLGLTICKEIVEAHGGCIAVASELGRGTVFSILLPQLRDR